MSASARQQPDGGNPFSTRHVRPGAVAYLFPPGEDISSVLGRLAENGWRGQIVGPHGSGKSTLLAALLPAIEHSGRQVVHVALHDGEKVSGTIIDVKKMVPDTFSTVLVIDGYEQLPRWRRWLLQRRCRRHSVGLLVTSHRSVGLPEVFRTSVDASLAERIVRQLLAERPEVVITAEEIAECARRHGDDLRETLFELYDRYEAKKGEKRWRKKVSGTIVLTSIMVPDTFS